MPEKTQAQVDAERVDRSLKLVDAYREIFDNPKNIAGQMVYRDLSKRFFQMKPAKCIVPGDPQMTGFHLGQRSVVDHILNTVTTDINKIIQRMKEERENHEY